MMTETVKLSQSDIRKLLSAANPDAALLYLYLSGGNRLERAVDDLQMNPSRVSCAAAALRQLGLMPDNRPSRIAYGEKPNYSEEDVIKALDYDMEFQSLRGYVERALGKPLYTEDDKILLNIMHYLGMSPEVVSQLVTYCITQSREKGRSRPPSLRTIEKEAYAWAERGIDTTEEASAFMEKQRVRNSHIGRLMQVLQIHGRNLTAPEERYAQSWLDMEMEDELISMAYERTCLNTGGLNWAYMNKILQRWHEQGLRTAEEVRSGDRKGGQSKSGPRQLDADEVAAIRKMMED